MFRIVFNKLSGHRPFLRLKNKIKWITYDNNDVSKAEHDIILQITEFRVLIKWLILQVHKIK